MSTDSALETESEIPQEERIRQAVLLIRREPAKRELYLIALKYAKSLEGNAMRYDVEQEIDSAPQKTTMRQSSGTLVDALVRERLLEEQLPSPEYDESTGEEFVDMAKASYSITELGEQVLDRLSPATRLNKLFEKDKEFTEQFLQLMEFCMDTPRSKAEIDALLGEACSRIPSRKHVAAHGVYPSFFVDRLESAGALVWKNGWTTTDEGKAFVQVFQ